MSQISEQQLKNTIRALSKALSSKVDKPERVNKHCKKTVITPAEKEERKVNKSPSRKINAEDEFKTAI